MATHGRELLGDHYDRDHLTYEEFQGKVFRFENRDDASGYVVRSMEETGGSTTLTYLQRV